MGSVLVSSPNGPMYSYIAVYYTLAQQYLYRDYFKAKVLFGYMDPKGRLGRVQFFTLGLGIGLHRHVWGLGFGYTVGVW